MNLYCDSFRQKVCLYFCILLLVLSTTAIIVRNIFAPMPIGIGTIEISVILILGFVNLLALKKKYVTQVAHALCLLCIVSISAIVLRGLGFIAPATAFLLINPILSLILLGKIWGIFYTITSVATLIALYCFQVSYGSKTIKAPIESIMASKVVLLTILILLIFTLVYFYESLRQSQELERIKKIEEVDHALKIRSLFIANMSHEFRTPLNGIVGMVDILKSENLPENIKDKIDIIESSADTLLSLISNILEYSKIESGKIEVDAIKFSPASEVKMIQSLLKPKADQHGVNIHFHNHTQDVTIISDKLYFKQIATNLIHNAVKFSNHKDIHVTLNCTDLSNKINLKLIVADHGTGLDLPQEHLFEAFSQLSQELHHRNEGTGLGLAISKKLAESMKGRLYYEPNQPEGSIFSFEFTASKVIRGEETQQRINLTNEPSNLSQNIKILLVEDTEINISVFQAFLNKLDLSAVIARNGIEAVKIAQNQKFDIIFMDIQMPILDGKKATEQIRLRGANKDTLIIALTGSVLESEKRSYLSLGMNQVLEKPIRFKTLERIVMDYNSTR